MNSPGSWLVWLGPSFAHGIWLLPQRFPEANPYCRESRKPLKLLVNGRGSTSDILLLDQRFRRLSCEYFASGESR
jgi:hypothetical protein